MRERLLCSCDGFCGASKQEAGAHVTCRLADGNLEQIRRLFSIIYSASGEGAWRCSQPLILIWWIVPTIAKLNKMPLKPARKDNETFG